MDRPRRDAFPSLEEDQMISNTYGSVSSVFEGGHFSFDKWEEYIDRCVPGAKEPCIADMEECIEAGYSWQNDFLPVLDSVAANPAKCRKAVRAFETVTEHLEEKIQSAFGRPVCADLVLYVGLCNGAGWVTEINRKTTILLGLEKILELGWYAPKDMTGLIIHELGHVYHAQYGLLHQKTDTPSEKFLWQLFTEGVAMVFEQTVLENPNYYHQDRNGWKAWCDRHKEQIRRSFAQDLSTMTDEDQRYFGDWVRFEGRGDTGYYLGAWFVRYLLAFDRFDRIIGYTLPEVEEKFKAFMRSPR